MNLFKFSKPWYCFLLLFMFSCRQDKELETALQLAGANRDELENVLAYYEASGDRQKLEAARFLIRHMPEHDYLTSNLDSVNHRIYAEMKRHNITQEQARDTLKKNYSTSFFRTTDVETITAKFLIHNIEWAFKVWREAPWGKYISFDHFCEEILPDRVGAEPPEEWRAHYYRYFQPILDSLQHDGNPRTACHLLYDALLKWDWKCTNQAYDDLGANILLKMKEGGHCTTQTQLMTFVMRSVGIPGGMDTYFHAPNKKLGGHTWNYFRDTTGKIVHFDFDACDMGYNKDTAVNHANPDFIPNHIERMSSLRKKGKVYRHDFKKPKNHLQMDVSQLPVTVQPSVRLRDVTSEYFGDNDISLNIGDDHGQRLSFLCSFQAGNWIAIDVMEIKKGKVKLNAIEPEVVFIPGFFINGKIVTVGYPFIYDGEKLNYLTADSSNFETVALTRKYSLSLTMERVKKYVVGGKFQVAHRADFSDAQTIHVITEEANMMYVTVPVYMNQGHQFIRYLSAENGLCNMAELEFYSPEDELLKGKIIGTDGTRWGNEAHTKYAVFDKDPLTYYVSMELSGAWVGLDFGKPKRIGKIRYLFRNDDNSIRSGDRYELFYFTPRGWISCGEQLGNENQCLVYEHVPKGALLWLRNHTRGTEERIFTYQNDRQIWW